MSLIGKGWGADLAVDGNPEKNQWKLVDKGRHAEHKEFMLTTDMCLVYKNNKVLTKCLTDFDMGKFGFEPKNYDCNTAFYDKGLDLDPIEASDCCLWTTIFALDGAFKVPRSNFCGSNAVGVTEFEDI